MISSFVTFLRHYALHAEMEVSSALAFNIDRQCTTTFALRMERMNGGGEVGYKIACNVSVINYAFLGLKQRPPSNSYIVMWVAR